MNEKALNQFPCNFKCSKDLPLRILISQGEHAGIANCLAEKTSNINLFVSIFSRFLLCKRTLRTDITDFGSAWTNNSATPICYLTWAIFDCTALVTTDTALICPWKEIIYTTNWSVRFVRCFWQRDYKNTEKIRMTREYYVIYIRKKNRNWAINSSHTYNKNQQRLFFESKFLLTLPCDC